MSKAVFLDRDGTINSDKGHYYIYRTKDFILNPGVIEGLKLLQDNSFLLIVVTNQGGIAKGEYTECDVNILHTYMLNLFAKEGVIINKIYHCPHHESVSLCNCRKPNSGMFEKAIKEFSLERNLCYMIGDSKRDIIASENAGIKGYKIEKNSSILPICKEIVKI